MRIWDRINPEGMCRQHLLGEHRELHGLWNILMLGKVGYSNHPETKRWVGHLPALRDRHDALVQEMKARGYNHNSPLEGTPEGSEELPPTLDDQFEMLLRKLCDCDVSTMNLCREDR